MPGVSESDIVDAEAALGLKLPADYERFLRERNDLDEASPGSMHLDLWSLDQVVELNADEAYGYMRQSCPGILLVGSDGASEMLAYDTRQTEPALYLVNAVSADWREACWQAHSLDELLAFLAEDGAFKFNGPEPRSS